MLKRKQHKMSIEDELHRVTYLVTEYYLFGIRFFRQEHEIGRRGSEISPYLRDLVRRMDDEECVYCGWCNRLFCRSIRGEKAPAPRPFAIDHIIPQVQGGATHMWNLAYACKPCNSRKQGRTPDEANMILQFGRFHNDQIGHTIPQSAEHEYTSADDSEYRDYVERFGYGEPFNSEFLRIGGKIPFVYPRPVEEHRKLNAIFHSDEYWSTTSIASVLGPAGAENTLQAEEAA